MRCFLAFNAVALAALIMIMPSSALTLSSDSLLEDSVHRRSPEERNVHEAEIQTLSLAAETHRARKLQGVITPRPSRRHGLPPSPTSAPTRRHGRSAGDDDEALPTIAPTPFPTTEAMAECTEGQPCRHTYNPEENEAGTPRPSMPSAVPSSAPSGLTICSVDDNGFFGDAGGEFLVTEFVYEIETLLNFTEEDTNAFIRDTLDRAIVNRILPGLFPDDCDFPRTRLAEDSVRRRRLTELNAISADPLDVVVSGAECDVEPAQGNECHVAEGKVTLIADSDDDLDLAEQRMLSLVRGFMLNGDFDNLDEHVVRVRPRNPNNPITTSGEAEGLAALSTGSSNRVPIFAWILIAMGVIGLNLSLLILYARSRKGSGKEDSSKAASNDYLEGRKTESFDEDMSPADSMFESGPPPPPSACGEQSTNRESHPSTMTSLTQQEPGLERVTSLGESSSEPSKSSSSVFRRNSKGDGGLVPVRQFSPSLVVSTETNSSEDAGDHLLGESNINQSNSSPSTTGSNIELYNYST